MDFKIRKALENHDEVCAHWFPKASLEEVEVCYKPKGFNRPKGDCPWQADAAA